MGWLKSEKKVIDDILESYDYGYIDDRAVVEQLAWDLHRSRQKMSKPELKLLDLNERIATLDTILKNGKDSYLHALGEIICLVEDGYDDGEHCLVSGDSTAQILDKITGGE